MTNKIIQPKNWKASKGYANGILNDNGHLFIGGQIGWNSQQIFETQTFVGQMEQTLINIIIMHNKLKCIETNCEITCNRV